MVGMIRDVQPVGPYRLAGWCVAGLLAYEIAQQLIGADEIVQFLGMLDTDPPNIPECIPDIPDSPKEQLLQLFSLSLGRSKDETIRALLQDLKTISELSDFEGFFSKCREMSILPPQWADLTTRGLEEFLSSVKIIRRARVQYIPQPIPIPIHLFVAIDKTVEDEHHRAWDTFMPTNRFRRYRVSGDHHTMLISPNVEHLGSEISQSIMNSDKQPPYSPKQHYSPLVTLQSGKNSDYPLFCIPGAGADVTTFCDLVASMNQAQPVYGLQPRGLDGILTPHSTVSSASKCYLSAIEEIYPRGPIHLLGHSFGGWVAFDMAQRFLDAGRHVALITILDSDAPDDQYALVREYSCNDAIMEMVDIFEQILGHSLDIKQTNLESRNEVERIELLHDRLVQERLLSRRSEHETLRGPFRTFSVALRTHYKPTKLYSGLVQLVLADDKRLDQDANRRKHEYIVEGWKRWAPNLLCTHISGNHVTMLKPPHVCDLVQLLNTRLHTNRAEAENSDRRIS
jgi:thioesterase domain-containing protein